MQSPRGPRSRGAVGVANVAGERGGHALADALDRLGILDGPWCPGGRGTDPGIYARRTTVSERVHMRDMRPQPRAKTRCAKPGAKPYRAAVESSLSHRPSAGRRSVLMLARVFGAARRLSAVVDGHGRSPGSRTSRQATPSCIGARDVAQEPRVSLGPVGDARRAMSQENVEIVRRLYERWATGDFSADCLRPRCRVFAHRRTNPGYGGAVGRSR